MKRIHVFVLSTARPIPTKHWAFTPIMTMVAGPCHVGKHDYTDQLGRNCALWLSLHRDVFHPVCGLEPQQDLLCLRLHVCDFGIALSRYCVRQHYLHLHPPERGGLQVAVAVVH